VNLSNIRFAHQHCQRTACLLFLLLGLPTVTSVAAPPSVPPKDANPLSGDSVQTQPFDLVYLRGKVVFLDEALLRRFDIRSVPDKTHRGLALETTDGHLYPLVMDVRGGAFGKDKRLREMDIVLMARQYRQLAMLQVIRVYSERRGTLREVDYWCEICAIAMYELKPCDCCQGTIDLREQLRKLNVKIR